LIVPDLDDTRGPANGYGREDDLLQSETQMLAVAPAGGALMAESGVDLVVTSRDLVARDASLNRHRTMAAGTHVHERPPSENGLVA
jgi:hypothetical protein